MAPGLCVLRNGSSRPVSGSLARSFAVTMPVTLLTGASLAWPAFQERADGVAQVEAFDGVGEVAHEIAAAEFAVGENFEAEIFLLGEDALDLAVFDGVQVGHRCWRRCGVLRGVRAERRKLPTWSARYGAEPCSSCSFTYIVNAFGHDSRVNGARARAGACRQVRSRVFR